MKTEFRRAVLPREQRSLVAFDHRVFARADWFPRDAWTAYESWWMIVNRTKAGCCAFEHHADFQDDLQGDAVLHPLPGSLYISSTGILPQFQQMGFGSLLKAWQISYARFHGFTRIVTNTRESNVRMIALNRKFNFKVLRNTPGYYHDPVEATTVMEFVLDEHPRAGA